MDYIEAHKICTNFVNIFTKRKIVLDSSIYMVYNVRDSTKITISCGLAKHKMSFQKRHFLAKTYTGSGFYADLWSTKTYTIGFPKKNRVHNFYRRM